MKIALIRHGRTEGNIKKRYIGKTDEPLFETQSLNLSYPECEAVIVSPLKRCVMTAEFIYPGKRLTICEKLRECDFGDFENKSYEDLKTNSGYIKWLESGGRLPFPNGEAHDAFVKRCAEGFFETALPRYGSIAYVVHGGTIMAVMQTIAGGDFYDYQIRCGGMITFEYDSKTGSVYGVEREDSE